MLPLPRHRMETSLIKICQWHEKRIRVRACDKGGKGRAAVVVMPCILYKVIAIKKMPNMASFSAPRLLINYREKSVYKKKKISHLGAAHV